MEQYMEISHSIMTDIYNISTLKEDYNFSLFSHNREKLAEMLEFAEDTRNSLFVYKANNSIDLVLVRGKSNYISERNILCAIKYDHNMIKSKNSMNILNSILIKLEEQLGRNDLLEIERQRGFVKKNMVDNVNDISNVFDEEAYLNNIESYDDEFE